MFFKVIALGVIFFVLRNMYKSWKLLQDLQEKQNQNNSANSKHPKDKDSDIIDAEYKVVDKK